MEPKPKKTITSSHGKFDQLSAKAPSAQNSGTAEKTSGTKSSKKKNKAKKAATKQNLEVAGNKAKAKQVERESKYKYPEGLDNKEKKEFRRKARATAEAFAETLKGLRKKTDAASVKEYEAAKKARAKFRKETYVKIEEEKEA